MSFVTGADRQYGVKLAHGSLGSCNVAAVKLPHVERKSQEKFKQISNVKFFTVNFQNR